MILEKGKDTAEIVLADWAVSEIDDNFSLDSDLEYRIKSLDLYGTANRFERSKISEKKIITLVRAMAKTSLKNSLKKVHVFEEEFPEDDLQKIFNKHGFKVEVIGDEAQPVEVN